jgi:transcriptional regulator with XRE-family HTH domain
LDVHVRLGTRVRELRLRRRLTQERLGAKAGLSYKFVGEVERGVANPTIETVAALATGLETDVADLFGPADRVEPSLATVTDEDTRALEKAVATLSKVLGRVRAQRRPAPRRRRQ